MEATHETGKKGWELEWGVNVDRFMRIVNFLIDMPREQQPCDAHLIIDARDGYDGVAVERDGDFDETIVQLVEGLLPKSVLTINFEDPPCSVAFWMPEVVGESFSRENSEGGDAGLTVTFDQGRPPAWLVVPAEVQPVA